MDSDIAGVAGFFSVAARIILGVAACIQVGCLAGAVAGSAVAGGGGYRQRFSALLGSVLALLMALGIAA